MLCTRAAGADVVEVDAVSLTLEGQIRVDQALLLLRVTLCSPRQVPRAKCSDRTLRAWSLRLQQGARGASGRFIYGTFMLQTNQTLDSYTTLRTFTDGSRSYSFRTPLQMRRFIDAYILQNLSKQCRVCFAMPRQFRHGWPAAPGRNMPVSSHSQCMWLSTCWLSN